MSSTSLSVEPPPTSITIHLSLPSHPSLQPPSITLSRSSLISDLKSSISSKWSPEKPKPNGITLVLGGRVVRDSEKLDELFEKDIQEAKLFMIVKPDAWTVAPSSSTTNSNTNVLNTSSSPSSNNSTAATSNSTSGTTHSFPSSSNVSNTPPAAANSASTPTPSFQITSPPPLPSSSGYSPSYTIPPPPNTTSTSPFTSAASSLPPLNPTIIQFTPFLTHLENLLPIQRAVLMLNLEKVGKWYEGDLEIRKGRFEEGDDITLNHGRGSGKKAEIHGKGKGKEKESDPEKGEEEGKGKEDDDIDGSDESIMNSYELEEVKSLFEKLGLWKVVEKAEMEAKEEWKVWLEEEGIQGGRVEKEGKEWEIIEISGLPYLLHNPPNSNQPTTTFSTSDLEGRYLSLKRGRAIHSILTTLINLLMTYQGSSSTSMSSLLGSTSQLSGSIIPPTRGLEFIHAALGLPPPPPAIGRLHNPIIQRRAVGAALPGQQQQIRRAFTFSIIINLEALISTLVPLFWLSLKLGFLLWIFGRHATMTKKYVLIGLGVGWLLMEGWNMYWRRLQVVRARVEARLREQGIAIGAGAAGENNGVAGVNGVNGAGIGADGLRRRRHVEGQAQPQPQAGAQQQQPPLDARALARAERRQHRHRHGHRSSSSSATAYSRYSIFSPKYWITRIALIGLVDEALELGLAPRSIAGRPVAYPPNTATGPGAIGAQQQQPQGQNHPNRPPGSSSASAAAARRQQIARQQSLRRSAFRTALIGIVLFFGTLIPEVERKRRKALEKRERLLTERRNEAERARAVEIVQRERNANGNGEQANGDAGASGGSGSGSSEESEVLRKLREIGERELNEERYNSRNTPSSSSSLAQTGSASISTAPIACSSSSSNQAGQTLGGAASSPSSSNETNTNQRQGRQLISDTDLFSDGLGESDQQTTDSHASSSSPSHAQPRQSEASTENQATPTDTRSGQEEDVDDLYEVDDEEDDDEEDDDRRRNGEGDGRDGNENGEGGAAELVALF